MLRDRLGLLLLGVIISLPGCCTSCCVDTGCPIWDLHCATPMPDCNPTWRRCGPYVPYQCENAPLEVFTEQTVGQHFYY